MSRTKSFFSQIGIPKEQPPTPETAAPVPELPPQPYEALYAKEVMLHAVTKHERDKHAVNAVELMRQRDAALAKIAELESELKRLRDAVAAVPWPPYRRSRYDNDMECAVDTCTWIDFKHGQHSDGCPVAAFEALRVRSEVKE